MACTTSILTANPRKVIWISQLVNAAALGTAAAFLFTSTGLETIDLSV